MFFYFRIDKSNLLSRAKTLCLFLISLFIFSCQSGSDIELIKSNLNKTATYTLDYSNAYKKGFIIPSLTLDEINLFEVSFRINNVIDDELYYKIYYQNESYKFPEEINGKYNPLAGENFYGSWDDFDRTFERVELKENGSSHNFSTTFLISGNPRNEKRYYGANRHNTPVSENSISKQIEHIKKDEKWFNSIKEKAEVNNVTIKEQLKRDARWFLSKNTNKTNNKWQRNPRVGNYSLLIVVVNKEGLNSIPKHIKNISVTSEGSFINPYYYFLYGDGKSLTTLVVENMLTIKADVPLANGIYVPYDTVRFKNDSYFNNYVGNNDELYSKATFSYNHSYQSNTESFMNIPVRAEFHNKGYNQKEYEENRKKPENERVETFFTNTRFPGQSFGVNAKEKTIWFKNPANKEGENRKENVGIKTRHGLTYGKYTFKIKMAELLTKDNIWTGLTNAIWMINESGEEWNKRRICKKEGFMPFYGAGKGQTRVPQISYSEIDFEILKAAETWPKLSYKDQKERNDPKSHKDKVMIACTNWDMACKQPKYFDTGLRHIDYEGNTFNIHRWDEYYNALTSKVPELDDVLFGGEYYYFQLEWKPTEIIWRVGPEKDNLHVVGYMNDNVTTIPNNQMLAIITQEYHFSKWWPKSPFKQEDIPFPGEDLNGKLYSLEIE
jgi:hypothetical protein